MYTHGARIYKVVWCRSANNMHIGQKYRKYAVMYYIYDRPHAWLARAVTYIRVYCIGAFADDLFMHEVSCCRYGFIPRLITSAANSIAMVYNIYVRAFYLLPMSDGRWSDSDINTRTILVDSLNTTDAVAENTLVMFPRRRSVLDIRSADICNIIPMIRSTWTGDSDMHRQRIVTFRHCCVLLLYRPTAIAGTDCRLTDRL